MALRPELRPQTRSRRQEPSSSRSPQAATPRPCRAVTPGPRATSLCSHLFVWESGCWAGCRVPAFHCTDIGHRGPRWRTGNGGPCGASLREAGRSGPISHFPEGTSALISLRVGFPKGIAFVDKQNVCLKDTGVRKRWRTRRPQSVQSPTPRDVGRASPRGSLVIPGPDPNAHVPSSYRGHLASHRPLDWGAASLHQPDSPRVRVCCLPLDFNREL